MPRNDDHRAAAPEPSRIEQARMAKGAGLAFAGRLGALIEILTFFLFANLFGDSTFGLFIYFWEAVFFISTLADLGMTQALQRFVPAQHNEEDKHRVVRYALLVAVSAGVLIAIALFAAAPILAPLINAGIDNETKVTLIRIYVWAIPIWTFIDVATSCIRAREVFGPEVKVRIFYEQLLRLIGGIVFYLLGYIVFGLFISHVLALFLTGLFALRLLSRYYDLRMIVTARLVEARPLFGPLFGFGTAMLLPNLAKKGHSRFPAFFINAFIPGAEGAAAVGYYALARKIVSALHVIRESFEYVLAPIASAKNAGGGHDSLRDVYSFATRLIVSLFIPLATCVVALREDLLGLSGPEYLAATGVLIILAAGRGMEALSGPSSAVISMIGRYRMPFWNAVTGLGITIALLTVLVPQYGITGAAIAAALGINVTAYAALFQVHRFFGLHPYSVKLLRPTALSVFLSSLIYGALWLCGDLHTAARFAVGVVMLALSVYLILRFGLHREDPAIFRKSPL